MLDELQLTYTSYNGQNLNSPAVSVIRGSTVLSIIVKSNNNNTIIITTTTTITIFMQDIYSVAAIL
jgi:hypothetical protein